MEKVFRNSLFLVGLPLAICGLTFGLTGLMTTQTLVYAAPGLLIPGLVFMLIGWRQAKK